MAMAAAAATSTSTPTPEIVRPLFFQAAAWLVAAAQASACNPRSGAPAGLHLFATAGFAPSLFRAAHFIRSSSYVATTGELSNVLSHHLQQEGPAVP